MGSDSAFGLWHYILKASQLGASYVNSLGFFNTCNMEIMVRRGDIAGIKLLLCKVLRTAFAVLQMRDKIFNTFNTSIALFKQLVSPLSIWGRANDWVYVGLVGI